MPMLHGANVYTFILCIIVFIFDYGYIVFEMCVYFSGVMSNHEFLDRKC